MNPFTDQDTFSFKRPWLFLLLLASLLPAACGARGGPSKPAGQAATGSPIRIGMLADVTGPFAVSGAALHVATDLVVQQTNASGGINGHRLEVTYVDPKGDPALGLSLAQQLVQQDHVDVLMGGINSAECLGIEQLVPKLGVVYMVANGCLNEELTAKSCNKYTFRVDPAGKQLVEPAGQYVVQTYGKRWLIMYSDYAYGQSQSQAYQAAIEKTGGAIKTKIPVPLGETNMTSYVSKIPLDGSLDGVIIAAEPQGMGRMVNTLQQFGVYKKLPIVGVGTREQVGGTYPEGVNGSIGNPTIHLSNPLPNNKFDQDFETSYKAQVAKEGSLADVLGGTANAVSGQNGYASYTAVTAMKLAMIQAKFTGRADTEKLIATLENLKIPQGADIPTGPLVMTKADHQGRMTVFLSKINGQADELLASFAPDKVPEIGDCKVQ